MGALKIDGSKAKYISDQMCLLINFTYMNRQYLDRQKIIYYPIEILFIMPGLPFNLIPWITVTNVN